MADARKQAILNIMKTKIAGQPKTGLEEMARQLFSNIEEGSDIVFTLVLNELEQHMPSDEFVTFCDNLGA